MRQPLKTPPELVTLQLGEPNSETPTPASPPPTKSVIYAALGLPPGGSAYPRGGPLISLIPPKALVVVDAGFGNIIDDKGMFWHNGGNVGFRSLYAVSGNPGM